MRHCLICILLMMFANHASAQTAFFVDGFHGGIYGHYPLDWYTQYIIDQLEVIKVDKEQGGACWALALVLALVDELYVVEVFLGFSDKALVIEQAGQGVGVGQLQGPLQLRQTLLLLLPQISDVGAGEQDHGVVFVAVAVLQALASIA